MPKKVLIIDSTLRDGSHYMRHQFTTKQIADYAKGAQLAGVKILIVGHGNGLGASSLQLGQSLNSDKHMLTTARKYLTTTKLGAFLIPGFGTIKDDLEPALKYGIKVLMVASHCTEANITRQHIEYSVSKGLETYGVLMMSHMLDASGLLKQARLMQSYGASGILLMDSAGAYLPADIIKNTKHLIRHIKVKIGFHAHNNLGMSIATSVAAVQSGASFIDVTSRALGAGAGNCQMEVLVAVLHKLGFKTGLDLKVLMENAENIVAPMMKKPIVVDSTRLASGLAGIFSGFAPLVENAAKKFNVSTQDIFFELGKRKIVAGQEDIILDVANELSKSKKNA